jgi:hypothetical protein
LSMLQRNIQDGLSYREFMHTTVVYMNVSIHS